jgi:hypothetical protein
LGSGFCCDDTNTFGMMEHVLTMPSRTFLGHTCAFASKTVPYV